jgi:hypothetical protein
VQLSAFGPPPGWYLLADAGGVLDYALYAFGMRQFLYDRDLGDDRAVSCDPTVDDLRLA